MNKNEIILQLSKAKIDPTVQMEVIEKIKTYTEWEYLVGQLIFHKVLCRAYKHFLDMDAIEYIPPAIEQSMRVSYRANELKHLCIQENLYDVVCSLNQLNIQYAIIKGITIEQDLFCDSVREYNDIDLLISFNDLDVVNRLLISLGYQRGIYDPTNNLIYSDRREDIFYIANTHQTLPYRKLSDNKLFPVSTIDVQFDYTLNRQCGYNINISEVLSRTKMFCHNNLFFSALDNFDNFILMCTHLYGEAILLGEIKKSKDLQLNKIVDIYEWIERYYDCYDWEDKTNSIYLSNLIKPVYYCTYLIANLYKSNKAQNIMDLLKISDVGFLDEYRDDSFDIKKWKAPLLERVFKTYKDNIL